MVPQDWCDSPLFERGRGVDVRGSKSFYVVLRTMAHLNPESSFVSMQRIYCTSTEWILCIMCKPRLLTLYSIVFETCCLLQKAGINLATRLV
jgi:hypothetical protein